MTPSEKRRISISTCFDYNVPLERQLPFIANVVFTHVSIGSKHLEHLDDGRRDGLQVMIGDNGLLIDTIHAPRVVDRREAFLDAAYRAACRIHDEAFC